MRRRNIFWTAVLGWVLWRLFAPEIPPRFRGVQRRPDDMPGRTVTVGRREWFVRELGDPDAPPIVLVHGWLYDGFATWHRVAPELAIDHRVIIPDLRNHGKTDQVRGRFEIEDSADELAALLRTLGLTGVPVVGYSMGGMVAQELTLRHPGVVSRLVLAATAAAPVQWPRWITVPGMVIGRALSRLDRTTLPRISYRYLMHEGVFEREDGEWLWRNLLDRDVDMYYESGFAILRFDARDRVRRLGVPVRSIIPTRDQLIPADNQRETAELAGSEVIEIDARHEAVLSHSGEVAKAIAEFVRA
jgi:pimeloyl-ACP methyl ester carboxylesterase